MAKIKARQKYFDAFSGHEEARSSFGGPSDFPTEDELLFAIYEQQDYEGNALLLFTRDGVLYEVSGSHCSCNGLEECWEPEATSAAALLMRPNVGLSSGCGDKERDSLLQVLGAFIDPTATVPAVVKLPTWRRAMRLAGVL